MIRASARRRGEILVALGVLALAGVAAWQTAIIPTSPAYARVGPTAFPTGVAVGLGALGLALLFAAVTGRWRGEEAHNVDRRALFWLLLGLALNVALIPFLGFIIASSLLFVCVARAFGSTRLVRDLGIAVALATIAYLGFDRLLGMSIGAGVLEGLF